MIIIYNVACGDPAEIFLSQLGYARTRQTYIFSPKRRLGHLYRICATGYMSSHTPPSQKSLSIMVHRYGNSPPKSQAIMFGSKFTMSVTIGGTSSCTFVLSLYIASGETRIRWKHSSRGAIDQSRWVRKLKFSFSSIATRFRRVRAVQKKKHYLIFKYSTCTRPVWTRSTKVCPLKLQRFCRCP